MQNGYTKWGVGALTKLDYPKNNQNDYLIKGNKISNGRDKNNHQVSSCEKGIRTQPSQLTFFPLLSHATGLCEQLIVKSQEHIKNIDQEHITKKNLGCCCYAVLLPLNLMQFSTLSLKRILN